jgi:methyl-accepting chemotaxis protein
MGNKKIIRKGMQLIHKLTDNKLFRTIRVRLIASFMVPVAFIILLGVVSFQQASSGITSSYEKSTSRALDMAGDYLSFGFDSVKATGNQYSNDATLKKFFVGFYDGDIIEKSSMLTDINNEFTAKKMTDKFIGDLFVLSDRYAPVSTLSTTNPDSYAGFLETEFGKNIKENKMKVMWIGSDAYLDENLSVGSDEYAMRMIRMIPGTNAILIIDVKMSAVEQVLKDLEFDGVLCMITPDGKEIKPANSSDEDKVKQAPSDSNNEVDPIFTDEEFYKKAVESTEMKKSDLVKYNGEDYMFMYSKIGDTGAMICGLVPQATIVSQADSIKNTTIIVVIISILVAVGTAVLISSGIDKVIKSIIANLKIAAKGDLTVDFSTKRNDEFRILMEEIQNTFSNMKNLIQQVKQLSTEVSVSSENVTGTSKHFLESTEEISVAMNEIESGVMQQAKDAEECLSQMDNLSKKIVLVSDNTKEISQIAESTKISVEQGTITTDDLNKQTIETTRIAADIIEEIQNLEKKSTSINKIINVINEIANQTNLLSLNASIEAARAGEAGKGFAVVASEIRALADQSKESVNNIKAIIDGIQKDTESAVNTARQAETVMRLQESAVKNTTESYRNINESVENLVVYLKQISENVDNIEEARVSTLGAIESISAVLEEIAASSNTVNQTATDQLTSVEILNKSADKLNSHASVLVDAVEKFKV